MGIYIPEFDIGIAKRISNKLSVYTAEMVAIIISLQWVEQVKSLKVVICSDSAAAMQSMKSGETAREDLLLEVYLILLNLQHLGIDVHFCWIPAHTGIEGNETADKLAKSAVNKNGNNVELCFGRGEAKSISQGIMTKWQELWNNDTMGRGYFELQNSVRVKRLKGKCRKDVTYSRIRLGHTGLNSTLFIMKKVESDKCETCGCRENVEHVIFGCGKFIA